MPSFEFKYSEFPETSCLPKGFEDLLTIGKKEAKIELFDRQWEFATLEEWEYRAINRRLANLDIVTRSYLLRLDVLTNAIISCTDLRTSVVTEFKTPEQKPVLRSLLLLLDPKVVQELYTAYQILEESANRSFQEVYGKAIERIRADFFGLSGGSSKLSASKTQEILNS